MITSVVETGIPPHQLEAVCQSVLVVPSQVTDVTVIVSVFEVAGLSVAHGAFEVILTVIEFPFVKVDDVYVGLVAPLIRLAPLYHW